MATRPSANKAKLGGSLVVATGLDALSLALPNIPDAAWALMPTSKLNANTQRLAFSNKGTLLTFKTPLKPLAVKSAQAMMRARS
jgi:hypothetical protein